MEDSFEIEPGNKSDKFSSLITHKEEAELSGSQTFLSDKFTANSNSKSPYLN